MAGYNYGRNMGPVQKLLFPEVTDHLSKPNWFNKNWLAIHAPLVKACIKRARDTAIGGGYGRYDSTLLKGDGNWTRQQNQREAVYYLLVTGYGATVWVEYLWTWVQR